MFLLNWWRNKGEGSVDTARNDNDTDASKSPSTQSTIPAFRGLPKLVPLPQAQGRPGRLHTETFEYGEHHKLGDALKLRWHDGETYIAYQKPFTLPNGLEVTYGGINGLAGDLYGTSEPISDGKDLQDQVQRFLAAWHWLGVDTTRNPGEAEKLLEVLQLEINALNVVLNTKVEPSLPFSQIPDQTLKLEEITLFRPSGHPSYLGLAFINYDHFGADARTAYTAGHRAAIEVAIGGKPDDLPLAYAMNAHADHFLEDSFSAGHQRTPRRQLHNFIGTGDICAKFMHDEDNSIGLQVKNSFGTEWTSYGDKRLLDKMDNENVKQCLLALQASVDEIYEAWQSKQSPEPSTYSALRYAPTVDSAQTLAPLFLSDGQRRSSIRDRRTYEFTYLYTFPTTILDAELSGLWNFPITM
ncbi:hypothetical protein MMC13_004482 [Lambiella insularis]|nr:hypothetical protein [Lambiella insularis]